MKGIILTLTLLVSASAFAWTNWNITNVESHVGLDPQTVSEILAAYPEVLANSDLEASEIDYVHVSDATFEYTAETICEEGDERLTHHELTYMACPKDKPTECIIKVGRILSSADPCL